MKLPTLSEALDDLIAALLAGEPHDAILAYIGDLL